MAGPNTVFLGPTPEFPALMTDKLTSMRENGTMTDFTVTVQGDYEKLRCHKLVLAIHSPYYEAMFTTGMVEATSNTVHYDDYTVDTMRIVIDYCYHEQVAFPDDQLIPLIIASDFLQIKPLNKRCINEVKSFLNPENVLRYLTFAVRQNLTDMKDWCLEVIEKAFPEVSKQPAFMALTLAELQECLDEVLHYGKRGNVLNAVFRWIASNAAERGQYLEELVLEVDPATCSLPAILEAMETYNAMITANSNVLRLLTKFISHITSISHLTAQDQKSSEPAELVIIGASHYEQVNPECWSLDQKRKKFTKLCNIPIDDSTRHSVCAIPQGFALTGGIDSDLCVVFVASRKEWKRMPKMLRKRSEHASICINGKLYVLCGFVSGNISALVDCLTLESGQWESLCDSPRATSYSDVAELNKKLYMFVRSINNLFAFDVEKQVWTSLASLSGQSTYATSMIAVNGQLCVAGGFHNLCAWYNPATNSWSKSTQKPSMKRNYGSLVQQDTTTILLLGGHDMFGTVAKIEELNIADGAWSVAPFKMPAKLSSHKALYLNISQD